MAIRVSWDDEEQTITRIDFEDTFTMREVFHAWEQELALMNSVTHPIYSLNVLHKYRMIIDGLKIDRVKEFINITKPDHLQMTVQVATRNSVKFGLTMIAQTMPHQVHVVKTLNEAYALIDDHKQRNKDHIHPGQG